MLSRLFILLHLSVLFGQIQPLKVRGRIVGGNKAIYGQFPWHVLLKKHAASKKICGGSIISTEWILTASECVKNSPTVILMFGGITSSDSTALNMTSSILYAHSYLNAALIKLPEPLRFNERIQAIDLPMGTFKDRSMTGEIAELSGFGYSGDAWEEHVVDRLKYTTVRLTDIHDCKTWNDFDFFCAKNVKPTGTVCDGDMGGAMAWNDDEGRPVQIAIISNTPKFCDWPNPILFLKVTSLLGWIKDLTGVDGGKTINCKQ